ncbi:MAG TPA: HAD hydrolase family protein [Vicinamibacterales bacterium]|jgi:3-deoxy-D-manno-octulosonate 8-phosphate phosphatase (KDO 8-P phosphatase)
MPCDPLNLARKAFGIRLLLFDVDGVLTDGRILLHPDGSESKQFGIRDGTGIVWAQRAGIATGLLSARHSPATTARASQLGIRIVRQKAGDKLQMYRELLDQERLQDDAVAFMGDDLLDLPVLSRVGFSAAPADAASDVLTRVDWVSSRTGGDGAARELIELLLRAQGKWDAVLHGYLAEDVR